jgi:CheY-like chemotaxis protein
VIVELWWLVALIIPVLGFACLLYRRKQEPPRPQNKDAQAAAKLSFGDLNSRCGETILLVEDDQQVCNVAALALRSAGYRVLVATDADQALQVIGEEARLDLLVTDRQMPGPVQGDQLIMLARQKLDQLPALLVTGYPEGLNLNVPVLVKPYRMSVLLSHVYELLGRSSRNRSSSTLKRVLPAR